MLEKKSTPERLCQLMRAKKKFFYDKQKEKEKQPRCHKNTHDGGEIH